ncbi:MAG: Ig-like domain-containing protein, partial [Solirubrobacteraceae bacterium]
MEVQFGADTGTGGFYDKLELAVRGRLLAEGTADSPILFTSRVSSPVPGAWGAIYLDQAALSSSLNHVRVSGATTGLDSRQTDVSIANSVFDQTGGGVFLVGPLSATVSDSRFSRGGNPGPSPFSLKGFGAAIENNGAGGSDTVSFERNTFVGNNRGLHLAAFQPIALRANGNVVQNNSLGVYVEAVNSGWQIGLNDNSVVGNGTGVQTYVASQAGAPSFQATGNNIYGNSTFDWDLHNWRDSSDAQFRDDLVAEGNWWGTTSPGEIAAHVRDGTDDFTRGVLDYDPFLTGPAPFAPAPDTAAPDTSITAGPSGTINSTSASFSFSATEAGSGFECKLDAGAWAACSSPKELTGLSEGSHTFSVRAKDAAGNTDASEATRSFTVDTAAPDTSITAGPSGTIN